MPGERRRTARAIYVNENLGGVVQAQEQSVGLLSLLLSFAAVNLVEARPLSAGSVGWVEQQALKCCRSAQGHEGES